MPSHPLLSIVTVVFNNEASILRCINSVDSQGNRDEIEYIVIDGMSTDDTPSLIKKNLSKVDIFIRESDYGIYDAMNKGITASSGKYIMFLNSDDWLNTTNIVDLVKAVNAKNIDLAVANALVIDNGKTVHTWKPNYFDSRILLGGMPLCHQACIAKKTCFEQKFDINIKLSADYFWLKHVYLSKKNISFIDKDIVCFEWGGAAASNREKWISECIEIAIRQFNNSQEEDMRELLQYIYSGNIYSKQTPKLPIPFNSIMRLLEQNSESCLFMNSLFSCLLDRLCYKFPQKFYYMPIPLSNTQEYQLASMPGFNGVKVLDFLGTFNSNDNQISWLEVRSFQASLNSSPHLLKDLCFSLLLAFDTGDNLEYKLDGLLNACINSCQEEIAPPLVSVIIPIYNIKDYIRDCVISVLDQDYQNLEILCIDDGSPINCETEITDLISTHENLYYLRKPNGGLSSARNFGLKQASGKYIHFLDGDDYLSPGMYESLIPLAELFDSEIIKSNLSYHANALPVVDPTANKQTVSLIDTKKTPSYFSFVSPCASVYKKDFLFQHNLFFKEGITYEDRPFNLKSLAYANCIIHVSNSFYIYRWERPGSIMSTRNLTLKHFRDSLAAMNISRYQEYPKDFDKINILLDSLRYFTMCIDINVIPDSLKSKYWINFKNLFYELLPNFVDEKIYSLLHSKAQCLLKYLNDKELKSRGSLLGYMYLCHPNGSKNLPFASVLSAPSQTIKLSSCDHFKDLRSKLHDELNYNQFTGRFFHESFVDIIAFSIAHNPSHRQKFLVNYRPIVEAIKSCTYFLRLLENVFIQALDSNLKNNEIKGHSCIYYIHHSGPNYKKLDEFIKKSLSSTEGQGNEYNAHRINIDTIDECKQYDVHHIIELKQAIKSSILYELFPGPCDSILAAFTYVIQNPELTQYHSWLIIFPYSPLECTLCHINEYLSSTRSAHRPKLIFLPHGLPQKIMIESFKYDLVFTISNDPSWSINFSESMIYPLGFIEKCVASTQNKLAEQSSSHFSMIFLSQISGAFIHDLPSLKTIGLDIIKSINKIARQRPELTFYLRFRNLSSLKNILNSTDLKVILDAEHIPNVVLDDMILNRFDLACTKADSLVSCSSTGLFYAQHMGATAVQVVDDSIIRTWPYYLASKSFFINRSNNNEELESILLRSIDSPKHSYYRTLNSLSDSKKYFSGALELISQNV